MTRPDPTAAERQARRRAAAARTIVVPLSQAGADALAKIQQRDGCTIRAAVEAALTKHARKK